MASVDRSKFLQISSDESFQFVCNPCSYQGIREKAKFYCLQCSDYLCETCNSVHIKLSVSRNHQVLSGSMMPQKRESMNKNVQCICNKGNVSYYCKNHEEVTCIECKTLKHRHCQSLTIEEACDGLETTQDESTNQKMETLKKKLQMLQARRKRDLESLNLQTTDCRKSLTHFKEEIILQIEDLVEKSLSEIENCDSVQRRMIEKHIHVLDVALNQFIADYNAYKEAMISGEKKDIFIHSQLVKKTMATMNHALLDVEKEITPPRISFHKYKFYMKSLGIVNPAPVFADMEVESIKKLDVKSPCDKAEPWISGSLFMPDGKLVLCDRRNSSLKVLSASLTLNEQIKLPSSPRDVALMSNEEVVVSLPENKSLLYVTVFPALKLGSIITFDQICLGIAVDDKSIYVSFENGEVRIIDAAGKPQRNVYSSFRFKGPFYISVTGAGLLFVSENDGNNVRGFDDGREIFNYTNPNLESPLGMLVDGDGNVFVCTRISNNLQMIGKGGKFKRILLSETDGLNEPYTLSFRPCDNVLVVGGRNQHKLVVCNLV